MEERYKIILGDCLEKMKDIPNEGVDCVITDPPYGIGESMGKNLSRGRLAKATDYGYKEWDAKPMNNEQLTEIIRVSLNQIIFGGNFFNVPPSSCWIVWDKENGASDFADCELAWTSFKSAVRIFHYRWQGMLQGDMRHKEKRFHPTQKPLPLMEWIIKKYTKEGATILDPFMGSGTTGVACANLGRKFIGIELDPTYFKVAEKRIGNAYQQDKLTPFIWGEPQASAPTPSPSTDGRQPAGMGVSTHRRREPQASPKRAATLGDDPANDNKR